MTRAFLAAFVLMGSTAAGFDVVFDSRAPNPNV